MAVLLASCGVAAFLWAARRGQLDDLETPPLRMLLDDDVAPPTPSRPAGTRSMPAAPRNG
jgi:cbb3-type cytochrome oxidase maturation protein